MAVLGDGGAPFTSSEGTRHSFQQRLPQGREKETNLLGSLMFPQEQPPLPSEGYCSVSHLV